MTDLSFNAKILVQKEYNCIFYKDCKHFLSAIDSNLSQCCFINIGISYGGKAPRVGCFTGFTQERGIISYLRIHTAYENFAKEPKQKLKGTIVSSLSSSDLWF